MSIIRFPKHARCKALAASPQLLVSMAFTLLLSSSCANVGREFPTSRVSDIKIGQTTQAEIEQMFGSPWRTGVEDGQQTWTYGKYRYKLFGQTATKDLVIRFNAKNVVASYTFNTTERDK